jgi:hypothetical protein
MGYYSLFTLIASREIIEAARQEILDGDAVFEPDGKPYEPVKWYEHERDLRAFSANHPGELILLKVDGEEQGDQSHKYFRDGMCQVCRAHIAFDPFDPKELR